MSDTSSFSGSARRVHQSRVKRPLLETLEARQLLSTASPTFVLLGGGKSATPDAGGSPSVFTPALLRTAYGLNGLTFGSTTADGAGQTIAVIDAYNAPTLASDLKTFDSDYGLSDPTLTIEGQTGSTTSLPSNAPGKGDSWALETSLDVEWAHSIAPKANILVVEANSASSANLYAAVDIARNTPGVSVVSMSFSSDETSGDSSSYDSHFTTPSNHNGVTFLAATGDSGAYVSRSTLGVGYPAVSANVVAVGGTSLTTDATGDYVSESGWGNGTSSYTQGGGGGGISQYVPQPAYQKGIVTQSNTFRTVPDVSMDADPNTGVDVIDTYDDGNAAPVEIGGTSVATPLWAGIISLADEDRALNGVGTLDGATQTLPRLYALSAGDFHDVTTGNNGFAAGPGYDLVTGRGTPIANLLVPDLANITTTKPTPTIGSLAVNPNSVVADSTTPITLTASNVTEIGGTVTAVKFYIGSTLLGTGTQNGTTWTFTTNASTLSAGNYTYSAVATDGTTSSLPATAPLTVTNAVTTPGEVLGWNVSGQSDDGTQGLAPSSVASGLSGGSLNRGSGVTTPAAAPANAWGGADWGKTSTAGINANEFISFGATVGPSDTLSISALDLFYRRTATGPTSGLWQYQFNDGSWTTFATVANEFPSTSTSGAAITELSTTGVAGLQGIAPGTALSIRLVPYGSTGVGGKFFIYNTTGDDLRVTGSLAAKASAVVADESPLGTTSAASGIDAFAGENSWLTNIGDASLANLIS